MLPDSKPIESIRDFSVISVGFGLGPKSQTAVNSKGVKQTDLLVMWLLLLPPFDSCGICPVFLLDPLPASRKTDVTCNSFQCPSWK